MNKARVVIVDDSSFSVMLLTDMLVERGFDVVGAAHSLEEVRTVIKEKNPDIVTMDMTIPGTDGFECTEAVHEINPNIKVVFVSSMMDEELVKKAKEYNASGYIQKPVEPDELASVLNRIFLSDEIFEMLQDKFPSVFKEALSDTLNRMTKTIPEFVNENMSNEAFKSKGIAVVIGIIGKYSGKIILDLSKNTADRIAFAALKRDPKDSDETLAVIGEFTNIVAGNACSTLNRINKALGLRVAPPSILHGDSLTISGSHFDSMLASASTDFGEISIHVGFGKGNDRWTQSI